MHSAGVDLTIIECDTEVQQVYKYEPHSKFSVKGRGGTSFNPAFEEVNSQEFKAEHGRIDGLVYLTDGDNYDAKEVVQPDFPVLWALLPKCSVRYDWGYVTHIEVENERI
jgi:predicted metal-dependent peptidase